VQLAIADAAENLDRILTAQRTLELANVAYPHDI
jgi:hypothetical protein